MTDDPQHGEDGAARAAPRPPGEHPSVERLVAYEAGALGTQEVEELQDHLALCPECARALLDLQSFLAPAGGETVEEGAATRAAWQSLRSRLATPGITGERLRRPARRPLRARPAFLAAAAGLAALLLGLPVWLRMHAQPVRERTLPVYLIGARETPRGADAERPQVIVRSGPTPVVALPVPAGRVFPAYRVELVSWRGEQRQELAAAPIAVNLERGQEVQYLLAVVPAERTFYRDYRLRLLGVVAGRSELLAEHPVTFVTP